MSSRLVHNMTLERMVQVSLDTVIAAICHHHPECGEFTVYRVITDEIERRKYEQKPVPLKSVPVPVPVPVSIKPISIHRPLLVKRED